MNDKTLPAEADCCGSSCGTAAAATGATPAVAGAQRFRIPTMDCSAEEAEIRRALEKIGGIRSLSFQLRARTLAIDAPSEVIPQALDAIRRAGFHPETQEGPRAAAGPKTPAGHAEGDEHDHDGDHEHGHGHGHGHGHDHDHDHGEGGFGRMAWALGLAIAAEALSYFAPDALAWKAVGMVIAAGAIWLAGLDVYKKGMAALLRGKLNINALMSVAVTGAFVIGQWPEAAMVMALYGIAELIEARAVDRSRNAIQKLLELAPEEALVRQADGQWAAQPVGQVDVDSIVRIKPGERVPLDGVVTAGTSAVNQAPVTGESIPVDKAVGDALFAGTINESGELEMRVTAPASNTTLARIIHAVEAAQGTRAPTQRFVDQFAAIYTPAVFALAVIVGIAGPLWFGLSWLEGAYKALVLLVIGCPCALVISTPVSVVSGLAAAARRGILIKGGTYLESARALKAAAIDKTGTITEGKPKLVEWRAIAEGESSHLEQWALSLASRSDHPVSKAIAAGLRAEAIDISDFKALAGRGVEGTLEGVTLFLGNHRAVHERGLCSPELEAQLTAHETQGRTVTLLARPDAVLAIFAVADTIKESSRQAIADLKALGVEPVMLTGDNEATAHAIAQQAGINQARGDLLPEAKQQAVKDLQSSMGATAMVGDGINDAPALAQADIGFAMGAAGTDTAMESADVVIMNDNLQRVAETVRLSRRTHAVLWQNITIALGIKAVFFVLAVFGSATMWMAVFADMGASLLVVGNGLRLLNGARKR